MKVKFIIQVFLIILEFVCKVLASGTSIHMELEKEQKILESQKSTVISLSDQKLNRKTQLVDAFIQEINSKSDLFKDERGQIYLSVDLEFDEMVYADECYIDVKNKGSNAAQNVRVEWNENSFDELMKKYYSKYSMCDPKMPEVLKHFNELKMCDDNIVLESGEENTDSLRVPNTILYVYDTLFENAKSEAEIENLRVPFVLKYEDENGNEVAQNYNMKVKKIVEKKICDNEEIEDINYKLIFQRDNTKG